MNKKPLFHHALGREGLGDYGQWSDQGLLLREGAWPSGHALQTIISYTNEGREYQIMQVSRRTLEFPFTPLESAARTTTKG